MRYLLAVMALLLVGCDQPRANMDNVPNSQDSYSVPVPVLERGHPKSKTLIMETDTCRLYRIFDNDDRNSPIYLAESIYVNSSCSVSR